MATKPLPDAQAAVSLLVTVWRWHPVPCLRWVGLGVLDLASIHITEIHRVSFYAQVGDS
jgi:hypothetical protein